MSTDLKIFVAHSKPSHILKNEVIYPIHVGAALSKERLEGMAYYDDDGKDNISRLNKKYCELTGMYYVYKNVEAEYYGFCHYRRYFSFKKRLWANYTEDLNKTKISDIALKYGLTAESINKFIDGYDFIIQKPSYFFITNRAQYALSDAGKVKDLDYCIEIIKRDYPEMYKTAKRYMRSPFNYTCNMFIMKKSIFINYCKWLFDILHKFDSDVDCSGYTPSEYRVCGYLAERLTGIYYCYLKKLKTYKLKTISRVFLKNAAIATPPIKIAVETLARELTSVVIKRNQP